MIDRFKPSSTKYPIWNAGMGAGMAGPELVSGVSEAGGFGVLGTGALPSDLIATLILETRKLTRKPFGANIILPMSDGQDIATCFDNKIEVIILFWGDPQPFVKDAHRRGICVISQCGSAEESCEAASAGVDAVIVQGIEAGGHVKAEKPLLISLKETCRDIGKVPVIAAGGISTGKQIIDCLALGAKAVSLGTRFVASAEARASESYKDRIVLSSKSDTTLTNLYDVGWENAKHRVIKTGFYDNWLLDGSPKPGSRIGEGDVIGTIAADSKEVNIPRYSVYPPLPNFKGDIEELPFYAGESVEGIIEIQSVSEIMKRLIKEMKCK